ncbi:MAG: DUF1667 domain-containing protein [Eubacteriaceae bacterium]|jgi:CxxC motif-containing protein
MIEKEVICVICPSSCHINVKGDGKSVSEITGFTCKRGKEYAENEYIAPKRTLATTVKAEDYSCPIIAVRSNSPLPKEKIFEAMEIIRKTVAKPPFFVGKVVIENILDTGVDIVLTNQ